MTAWLDVDLGLFAANLRAVRERIAPAEHMLVVKDDAYGHGLVRIVRAYLAGWRPEQLAILPLAVGAVALSGSEDIAARAVLAAQAELKAHPTSPDGELLREMSLTMGAAASRLRYLTTMRSRERVR